MTFENFRKKYANYNPQEHIEQCLEGYEKHKERHLKYNNNTEMGNFTQHLLFDGQELLLSSGNLFA